MATRGNPETMATPGNRETMATPGNPETMATPDNPEDCPFLIASSVFSNVYLQTKH
jgi:hypothetical protein